MQNAKAEKGHLYTFIVSIVIFAVFTAVGMIVALKLNGNIYNSLSDYLNSAFLKKAEFKQVFTSAVIADFRYTVLVMIFALGAYTSFIPLLLIAFRGFCSGLSVVLTSNIMSMGMTAAISTSIFLSCIVTIPIYTMMFMLCRNCSKKLYCRNLTVSEKFKEYASFIAFVMLMFAFLCVFNCILALLSPAITGLAKIFA